MTRFLPPLATDNYYLVLPKVEEGEDLATVLFRPARPFTGQLWLASAIFLLVAAAVLALVASRHEPDLGNEDRAQRFLKALYLSYSAFVNGPRVAPSAVPMRISNLGLNFFVLASVAAYTANLAQILVTEAGHSGVTSIEEAIKAQFKICAYAVLLENLQAKYNTDSTTFVPTAFGEERRNFYAGKCDALLLSDFMFHQMQSGAANIQDCNALRMREAEMQQDQPSTAQHPKLQTSETLKHSLSDGLENACKRELHGGVYRHAPTADCALIKVGPVVTSFPFSFAIGESKFERQAGEQMVQMLRAGVLESINREFKHVERPSQCATPTKRDHSMPLSSMVGVFFFSGALMVLGLLLHLAERILKCRIHRQKGAVLKERSKKSASKLRAIGTERATRQFNNTEQGENANTGQVRAIHVFGTIHVWLVQQQSLLFFRRTQHWARTKTLISILTAAVWAQSAILHRRKMWVWQRQSLCGLRRWRKEMREEMHSLPRCGRCWWHCSTIPHRTK